MTPEFKTLCEAFEALAAKLDARLTRMEARGGIVEDADTAPGHPELPLATECHEAADPLTLVTEWQSEIDPTLRDLPFPEGVVCPELPPGKTRWVNRGCFRNYRGRPNHSRHIQYLDAGHWWPTCNFDGPFIHIEAI